jgi:hypothetical protein
VLKNKEYSIPVFGTGQKLSEFELDISSYKSCNIVDFSILESEKDSKWITFFVRVESDILFVDLTEKSADELIIDWLNETDTKKNNELKIQIEKLLLEEYRNMEIERFLEYRSIVSSEINDAQKKIDLFEKNSAEDLDPYWEEEINDVKADVAILSFRYTIISEYHYSNVFCLKLARNKMFKKLASILNVFVKLENYEKAAFVRDLINKRIVKN